jgi:hypothetical protein
MGSYVEDYKTVAGYFLKIEQVKKVVPESYKIFEEKAEELLVALKMMNYHFKLNDVLEYITVEENESEIEAFLSQSELNAIEPMLSKVTDYINDTESEFTKKTGITLYKEYSKVDEKFYFEMRMEDVVVLSPNATKLKDSGVNFGFQNWVDNY